MDMEVLPSNSSSANNKKSSSSVTAAPSPLTKISQTLSSSSQPVIAAAAAATTTTSSVLSSTSDLTAAPFEVDTICMQRNDGYFAAGKGSPGIVHAAAAATSTKVPTTFSHIDQFAVSTATFVGGYSSSAANAAANAAVAAAAAAAATAACTNSTSPGCDIQQHLQSMFSLLRKEETLKMAVKLETARSGRTRYLVVVSRPAAKCHLSSQTPPSSPTNQNAQSHRVRGGGGGYSSMGFLDRRKQLPTLTDKYSASSRHTEMLSKSMTKQRTTVTTKLQNCDSSSNSFDAVMTTSTTMDAVATDSSDDDLSDSHRSNTSSNASSSSDIEESCLLGIDCNEKTTVGLVLRILADTTIRLDGDGGFSISVYERTHIFKPVSVQAMWSALQTLHKVSAKARSNNNYPGGPSHDWVQYYEERIQSERSCLNEWNAMDSLESRRPPSPDAVRTKPTQREETEQVIKTALKEIMMSVDLDEVTSKYIRSRLEEHLKLDLGEFKSFIDQEMLIILGQMDAPTEIFEHVYLGSEWNASNLEELQRNGVGHILNVTREIDNFFPGQFDYCNVRVYDDEKTNLLKHWDNTFKYITRARAAGSKVLVHCKMGVSRSASVVIAYAMKAHDFTFKQALHHVKCRRSCIKPNKSFLSQLETYQGMLDAMKNKEKLQRSKSETNLRCSSTSNSTCSTKDGRLLPGSEPTPLIQALNAAANEKQSSAPSPSSSSSQKYRPYGMATTTMRRFRRRPDSWSPDHVEAAILLPKQHSQSLENLTPPERNGDTVAAGERTKNVRLPCSNGQNYSVSQNQVVHLQENYVPSVKLIVSELESNKERILTGGSVGMVSPSLAAVTAVKRPQHQPVTVVTSADSATWDPGDGTGTGTTTTTTTIDVANKSNSKLVKNSNLLCDSPASWTSSSAQIILKQPTPAATAAAAAIDRSFDEKKIHRHSLLLMPVSVDSSSFPVKSAAASLVSRQSSFSSVDSAVALSSGGGGGGGGIDSSATNTTNRDLPSRHSSWGSGDNSRLFTQQQQQQQQQPSRNSSFGSYDMRSSSVSMKCQSAAAPSALPYEREDIPWHPGTVKRTKQKIENTTETVKRICPTNVHDSAVVSSSKIARAIDIMLLPSSADQPTPPTTAATADNKSSSPTKLPSSRYNSEEILSSSAAAIAEKMSAALHNRLSASAPETSTMSYIGAAADNKKAPSSYRNVIMSHQRSLDESSVSTAAGFQNIYGIVQNLKMNFEPRHQSTTPTKKVKSLPSSPIAAHHSSDKSANDSFQQRFGDAAATAEQILEEINVKDLVDRYEVTKTGTPLPLVALVSYSSAAAPQQHQQKPRPRSVFEARQQLQQQQQQLQQQNICKPLMINHSTVIGKIDEFRRPPVPPTVRNTLGGGGGAATIPSSVLVAQQQQQQQQVAAVPAANNPATCKRMQQHGKTHPLSRLGLPQQQRLNTATYNTM